VPHLGFQPEAIQPLHVKVPDQFESAYYLRFDVNDVAGVMSKLSAKFADQNISIEAITQKEPNLGQDFVSVIFITQRTREGLVDQAIKSIESMADVRADAVKIRVEHFN
jgi:homoserine dehydrogenase